MIAPDESWKSEWWADVPCIEWHLIGSNGYGKRHCIRFGKHIWAAHVVAWIDDNAMLPPADKPCVLHHCDNRPCIEPWHLWAGTQQDNVTDMNMKGRNNNVAGFLNGNVKLTLAEVAEIKLLYGNRSERQRPYLWEIASAYGVTIKPIRDILNGRTWKTKGGGAQTGK